MLRTAGRYMTQCAFFIFWTSVISCINSWGSLTCISGDKQGFRACIFMFYAAAVCFHPRKQRKSKQPETFTSPPAPFWTTYCFVAKGKYEPLAHHELAKFSVMIYLELIRTRIILILYKTFQPEFTAKAKHTSKMQNCCQQCTQRSFSGHFGRSAARGGGTS